MTIIIPDVLGDGIAFVERINVMGGDERIASCARASTTRGELHRSQTPAQQVERDTGLINRLMRDHHTSPFEAVVFQWRIRAPIFVARQHFRHRWGSYNEESGRYVELKDEFFRPSSFRLRMGKAMDYTYADAPPEVNAHFRGRYAAVLGEARALYEEMLAAGIAREVARMILPVAQYTTFFWTVNALSLMNWLFLRNHPHAQAEIRAFAEVIEAQFKAALPITHAAFRQHWGVAMCEGDSVLGGIEDGIPSPGAEAPRGRVALGDVVGLGAQ